jgi:hypothetical protein
MPSSPSHSANGVPRWLVVLGSLVIGFHFFALVSCALATTSGPWSGMEGPAPASPPQFAMTIGTSVAPYLRTLRMTHTYRFSTNRPIQTAARLEVRLKDGRGEERTLTIPDPNANYWVRYRQAMLVRELTDDMPVMPPQGGEKIPAPNREVPRVKIWDITEPHKLAIREVEENLIPRDRPVMRPSDWSLLLARAYARHLCRTHGAASAQLTRVTREPISPIVLSGENVPQDAFEPLISNFGELSK